MQVKINTEGESGATHPSKPNLTIRLPLELRQELEDIMYSERRRGLSNVAIELMRLGLATRKGEVKA